MRKKKKNVKKVKGDTIISEKNFRKESSGLKSFSYSFTFCSLHCNYFN